MPQEAIPNKETKALLPISIAATATEPVDSRLLKDLTETDRSNYFTRWVELSRFIGAVPRALIDFFKQDQNAVKDHTNDKPDVFAEFNNSLNGDLELGLVVGNGCGLITGLISHYVLTHYKKYQKKDPRAINPLYRNFKTLASTGMQAGIVVAYFLPLPKSGLKFFTSILSDVFCVVFGLFAIPYWLIRHYVVFAGKDRLKKRNIHTRVGPNEGWSKYAKTALVYGCSFSQLVGYAIGYFQQWDLFTSMTIAGAAGGTLFFATSLVLIPLINKFTRNGLVNKPPTNPNDSIKDKFRNNYIRSGITLGLALGLAAGFFLGVFCSTFSGIGISASMLLFGAIGSVTLGTYLGVYGSAISIRARKKWGISENTDNSWDYATRNASYIFGFLGTAIGCLLPIPGGTVIGASVGAAIGGVIGWFVGINVIRRARQVQPVEEILSSPNAVETSLPWTQRVASGANIGSIIGTIIGFIGGILGGPLGAFTGAVLGGAIGGVIGATIGALMNKNSRAIIYKGIFGIAKDPVVACATVPTPSAKLINNLLSTSEPSSTSAKTLPNLPMPEHSLIPLKTASALSNFSIFSPHGEKIDTMLNRTSIITKNDINNLIKVGKNR